MEFCMEARALKPSLRRELSLKSTQQVNSEDIWCFPAPNALVSSEDFSVDCFFDFSNGELKESLVQEEEDIEEEEEKDSLSGSSSQDQVDDDNNSNSSTFSDSFLASELAVPVDDLADLEWVSHFVDDSLPEVSLLCPPGEVKPETHPKIRIEPEMEPVLRKVSPFFAGPVPVKARTKRSRPASRTWSIGSPQTESSSSSSSSISSSCLILTNSAQPFELMNVSGEPPMKKPKKRPSGQTGEVMGSVQFQRRCSHCQVQKTPQWRTGPLGPKTLCNACGVRYKSGRLFPEYRPACSPTFSGDIHSNSHRKVLEMRRKKETGGLDSRLNQMVPSF
ncbi:hypothetical protein Tsubulata_017974 [Turnera subulata]|uniref:GATA transcription factor n=1 Tax=Turnera subulata TaxID=218843 RepID=A0A9Q0FIV1_9ROSI|nr:hypothetical protein Tsubulata_017974 [Turnera subulata]